MVAVHNKGKEAYDKYRLIGIDGLTEILEKK